MNQLNSQQKQHWIDQKAQSQPLKQAFPEVTILKSRRINGLNYYLTEQTIQGKTIKVSWQSQNNPLLDDLIEEFNKKYRSTQLCCVPVCFQLPSRIQVRKVLSTKKPPQFQVFLDGKLVKDFSIFSQEELEQIQSKKSVILKPNDQYYTVTSLEKVDEKKKQFNSIW